MTRGKKDRHSRGEGIPLRREIPRVLGEFWNDPIYRSRILLAAALLLGLVVFVALGGR